MERARVRKSDAVERATAHTHDGLAQPSPLPPRACVAARGIQAIAVAPGGTDVALASADGRVHVLVDVVPLRDRRKRVVRTVHVTVDRAFNPQRPDATAAADLLVVPGAAELSVVRSLRPCNTHSPGHGSRTLRR